MENYNNSSEFIWYIATQSSLPAPLVSEMKIENTIFTFAKE